MLGFEPAIGVAQWALANEIGCMLRRHDVQQIEFAFDRAALAGSVGHLEPGFTRRTVDCNQVVIEVEHCAVTFHVAHQARHELGDAEQHRPS